jgi:hypothetical protein
MSDQSWASYRGEQRSAAWLTQLSVVTIQALYKLVAGLVAFAHPSANDSASSLHLRAVTDALHPLLGHPQSFLTGLKAWPGFLQLAATLTASFPPPSPGQNDHRSDAHVATWPKIDQVPAGAESRLLLSAAARLVLASLLPTAQQEAWKLLFNSEVHGKSFATFVGRISSRGPTVLVVRDPSYPKPRLYVLCT